MEVESFNPANLMQGVKDRIKATFVGLIPDDKWEEMVKKEVDAFFEPVQVKYSKKSKQNTYNYSSEVWEEGEVLESPFRKIIWEFCSEKLALSLKDKVFEDYFTNTWIDGKYEIHENMKKIIEEAAPGALLRMINTISMLNADMMRNQIQNYR